jgi:phage terminase large subunit
MSDTRLSKAISPNFYDLHKQLKQGQNEKGEQITEVWCKGGRGSTKSSFLSCEILLGLSKDKNAHAFVSRRYDNELRDSVFGQMQWAANKLQIDHIWRFMKSPMEAVNKNTGQKIIFRGVDNPLKAKSINLGFGYIKYFWGEEVDQYGGMEELRNILQSLFRGTEQHQIAFFSFNPPKSARSWVNQEVKTPKSGRIVHHSDYRAVPVEWLGERTIIEAEHLKETNESAYRHEYLGEEVGTGLEIFNNVEIREINDDEINTFDQIDQGLDFGFAVDPLCFLRTYYSRKKRELYIFHEIAGIGITNRVLSNMMPVEYKNQMTIADSAEPKSIHELHVDFGWRIKGAIKGPGSVEHGIKWLQDLDKIVVDPVRCPLSSKEFVNYALEVNRQGDIISKYPDKDNHAIDSCRYSQENAIGSKSQKMSVSFY